MTDQDCLLDNIVAVVSEFQLNSLKTRISQLKTPENKFVDVAVFGRFKAGKSSFLNHIFQKAVLPVGVIPVTAVITRVRYGRQEQAIVHYSDQRRERVPIESLEDFISESKNPENAKNVTSVDIELPSLKEFEGLQFVDTPGLGSVFKHNTETSLDWLPQVGVALVAVSVDPPLTESDVSLLRELQKFTPHISVLVTKSDLLSPKEQKDVLKFIRERIEKALSGHVSIWPFSIRDGYESLQTEMKSGVLFPLQNRRVEAQREIRAHKVKTLRDECKGFLGVALKSSEKTDSEREVLRKALIDERLNLASIQEEYRLLAREYAGRTRPFLKMELTKIGGDLYSRIIDRLKREMVTWRGSLWNRSRKFESWMRETFHEELSTVSNDNTALFLKPINDFHSVINRAVQSFQVRLTQGVRESLGVELTPAEFSLEVKVPATPDLSFSRLFDSQLDSLSFFIPMWLFGRLIERHFLKQVDPEVEKNLSRLASQWTESINQSILHMESDAEKFAQSQIADLECAISANQSKTTRIVVALKELSALAI